MTKNIKNQKAILEKLKIERLNPMQEEVQHAIHAYPETVVLSPTGTGKTLAFLLPILAQLEQDLIQVQAMIIVPSRELAIQIEQVAREMGTGFKINTVYGGRAFAKDKEDIKHPPALLIGTPGRIADHMRRETMDMSTVKILVLDEFDKSLEVGFEKEMKEIVQALPAINKKVLTSATQGVEIPSFLGITEAQEVNYLGEKNENLAIKTVIASEKDKLEALKNTLYHIGNKPGIIFCNFKNTIQYVSTYLKSIGIDHGCFYGGIEQKDRERALIKFRNGTYQILLATDLAARGIDIPELQFIIHYQLPIHKEEFTHRNGRTARMHKSGTAYVLQWKNENAPEFITSAEIIEPQENKPLNSSSWKTLFISGGRKDKISKGDIAGLFCKQGGLDKESLGIIELKKDCAFVAVKTTEISQLLQKVDNNRLKKKKVRVREI